MDNYNIELGDENKIDNDMVNNLKREIKD